MNSKNFLTNEPCLQLAKEKIQNSKFLQTIFFIVLVATPLCAFNSFVMTLIRVGMKGNFFSEWSDTFIIAYAITLPVAYPLVIMARKTMKKVELF